MSDVTFNEPQYSPNGGSRGPETSMLTRLVISLGLAKDEASAQRVLAISAVVIAVLAIGVYVWSH